MADRYQGRPFPADDYDRGGDQHDSGGSDPLAELARLIGQTDPFGTMGKSNRAPPPPVPRAAPRYEPPQYEEPQYEEPQYEEPAEEAPPPGPPAWMQRANARAVPQRDLPPAQEDYPSAVHPLRRHALPAPQYEDYPEEPAYQEAEQHADPSRYDDALYGQIQSGAQSYQREAAYPDDPYAYQDGYEEEPEPVRKRGGLLAIAAVLALAVVGTGAAFAYRTYVGGSKGGDPPIIKADNTPTKVIPAPADAASKTPDRMPIGEGTEKIVPREEKPVDVGANSGAPRVVFPPLTPNANPPAPASVATAAPPPPASVPTNGTLPSSEPRKIKTLSVRGDQADAAAVPAPPPAPAAAVKPAKSAARSAPPPAAAGSAPLSLSPDAQASAPAAPEPRRVATLQPPPGAPNAPTNPAASAGAGYLVQVSSQRSESDAQASYKALQSRYPAVLGSHAPLIRRADLGDKGVYYRAMVGPFSTPEEASQFCGNLKTAGGQCVVQRN
jgi:SPOR domain